MGAGGSRRGSTDHAEDPPSDGTDSESNVWAVGHSSTLARWKYSAVLWGFDPRIDYTSNVKARLQPWCTNGRYFTIRHDTPDKITERPYFLITITEGFVHQNTHIRLPCAYQQRLHSEQEPSGHYLKSAQVD